MDSWDKFSLPVPLKKESYYAELNDFNINDGDIEHVKNICTTFKINNLREYHDLYNRILRYLLTSLKTLEISV